MPFEIKAIGNPDTLEAALKLLGGVTDELSSVLDIKISRKSSVKIPKYNRPIDLKYVKPVQEKEKQ